MWMILVYTSIYYIRIHWNWCSEFYNNCHSIRYIVFWLILFIITYSSIVYKLIIRYWSISFSILFLIEMQNGMANISKWILEFLPSIQTYLRSEWYVFLCHFPSVIARSIHWPLIGVCVLNALVMNFGMIWGGHSMFDTFITFALHYTFSPFALFFSHITHHGKQFAHRKCRPFILPLFGSIRKEATFTTNL